MNADHAQKSRKAVGIHQVVENDVDKGYVLEIIGRPRAAFGKANDYTYSRK